MKNRLLTVLYGVAVFLFIVTFSISLPIYCRFFYYMQIEPLELTEQTGYDTVTIKQAYDEVLDYLTLPNAPFGTGVFKHSAEGMSHFKDCKVLFDLNATVLCVSFVVLVLLLVLHKRRIVTLSRPCGLNANFFSATGALALFAGIGILIAVDFDTAFELFHAICFPGKDNWLFNRRTDSIINILPEEFFLSCAILIIAALVCICLSIIAIQLNVLIKKRRTAR